MERRDRPRQALSVPATSRLRMVGYCLVLTAAAFVQQPGKLVGDTKFDLVVAPLRFLSRAGHLWDPVASFGQVQNQAYGYFWPMGPFFALLHGAALPGWVIQRLWWSVLLCVAFVGVVRVAQAMRLGAPGSQVLAGFAFALTPHVLTLIGPTSVEAWPTAWAPWVLLPLVRGAEEGSPRRAAALSALAVAMCGGVNAAAVLAVLPVGAVWLLTRRRGQRRRSLLLWWVPLTAAATAWWTVPLLLLGRYSPPFLDYIENAPITTSTTSLPDVLLGTSDWVAYASPGDWIAGHLLATTPLLLVDAAAVAALGLAGIARRDNPHARFLLLSLVLGTVIVTFGYTGPVHGWLADLRQEQLDGLLAPLRNLHKFDVVLRLPLVLGLAHLVARVQVRASDAGARALRAGVLLAAVSAVAGVAIPVSAGQLASGAPVQEVPRYWYVAADYLAAHAADGTALELPAAPFGDYLWGSPHDDVLQGLARSPWAVRNVVPLTQPGNVRMLDAVTAATELGRPQPRLAGFLASNGVGYLVVRNDLQAFRSGAPDPVVLHQALDRSPGLHRVASFGPSVGAGAVTSSGGRRLLTDRGRSAAYPAVEIYRVAPVASQDTPQVTALAAPSVPVVSGDPGSRLATRASNTASVLAGDVPPGRRFGATYLTDGLPRQESVFTSVRDNRSAVLPPRAPWRLRSVEANYRLYAHQLRWSTTLAWAGVDGVSASSSEAFADAIPPLQVAESPAAAVDGRPHTEFVSSSRTGATGQWWRMRFLTALDPGAVSITMGWPRRGTVTALALVTEAGTQVVPAPAPGDTATYALPAGRTRTLEIRAAAAVPQRPGGQLALAEVAVPGVEPQRELALPRAFDAAPDQVVVQRAPQRSACVLVKTTTVCDDFLDTRSGDSNTLNRRVVLGQPATYAVHLQARLAFTVRAAHAVGEQLPVQVSSTRPLSSNPAAGPLAAVDRDLGTTWVASAQGTPRLRVAWHRPTRVSRIRLALTGTAGASAPRRVTVASGAHRRTVVLDAAGRATFPALRTDHLTIRFDAVRPAYSIESGGAVRLPVGVSELRLPQVRDLQALSPAKKLRLRCGSGPPLRVDEQLVRTRVHGTLRALLSGRAVAVGVCGDRRLPLAAGTHELLAGRTAVSVPERLVLRNLAAHAPGSAQVVPLRVVRWGSTHRAVRLPARTTPTLVVVSENLNAGWRADLHGSALPVQRVDGWKQGWLVPAGAGGLVSMTYAPDRLYRAALVAGAVAALAVALLALRRPRTARHPRPLTGAPGGGWGDALVLGAAGGLLAGLPGVLVVTVALAASLDARLRDAAGWVAALLVLASGLVLALLRGDGFHAHSLAAQGLACLALAAAVVGANGPAFFKRRKGRSSR